MSNENEFIINGYYPNEIIKSLEDCLRKKHVGIMAPSIGESVNVENVVGDISRIYAHSNGGWSHNCYVMIEVTPLSERRTKIAFYDNTQNGECTRKNCIPSLVKEYIDKLKQYFDYKLSVTK